MPHRAHLFSLRIAHALRAACLAETYGSGRFFHDVMAGLAVGIIAIPLAMALAIASGVAPQNGLYTAIVGGFVIAATGGSRYSISGPTAAFVVLLFPVAQQYGLAGLLLATLMSGVILMGMAFARLGRLIEYIPESVTLGFTGGIAIVIAMLQIKDLLGLPILEMPAHFVEKAWLLLNQLPVASLPNVVVGVLTLTVMLIWPRLKTPLPPHLPAVILSSVLALIFNQQGLDVETIGSRFTYLAADGTIGSGIPSDLPALAWPWQQAGAGGTNMALSWALISDLLPSAFAIAMLGAIESLLCAVVLDGMSGKRHSANSELLGQGIGNLVVPFFGGITATAAIARSAANFKAGAQSPVAAMVHALVVLAGLVLLSRLLAYLPMAGMAALLLVVAWNMSEARKAVHLVKTAPTSDILVFVTCLMLTVLFDMVIAITVGVLLASLLFMKEIAQMTRLSDITHDKRISAAELPSGWQVFKINGPLFFAAADRIFAELAAHSINAKGIVLYMDAVPLLDSGGLAAMNQWIRTCHANATPVYFADWQFQPLRTLARANVQPRKYGCRFFPTLQTALEFTAQQHADDRMPADQ